MVVAALVEWRHGAYFSFKERAFGGGAEIAQLRCTGEHQRMGK